MNFIIFLGLWYLSGKGVKDKDANVVNLKVVKDGVRSFVTVVSGNTQVENIGHVSTSPSLPMVVDLTMEKDKLSSLEDTTVLKSFPPLSTPVTTAGNAPGKSSYANITGKKVAYPVFANYVRNTWGKYGRKWHPDENLLKEYVSIVPVWVKFYGVPVTAFSEDGLSAIATKLGAPLMLDSYTFDMCMKSCGRSSYTRVMIELQADVELKDNIVIAIPKITREGHYTCNVHVDAEGKKTVKKPSQTSRGVPVGLKIGFKHQKEYRHVLKKTTGSSSGNKKKGVEPTIEVSNLNLFDVLNLVDNDAKFGTNRRTTNLVNNEATLSGSSFMNIDNDEESGSNTPIGEKIDKIERQICEGKLRLLDNDRNPLVPTGIMESNSEVEVVVDETANLRISTSGKDGSNKGYGTNSLLEQWRDSYPDNDDYDMYDDDMYENHDLFEHLQSICDDLDITVHGKKKK
nr:hypothetical protein [Tanacetum cinerariifolium]